MIKDKKLYYQDPTKTKIENLFYFNNLAFEMKKPRQKACFLSRTQKKCLIATIKRHIILLKTEKERLFYIIS